MKLPFTEEQFFAVIERYNVATWPAAVLLGLVAALAAVAPRLQVKRDRAIGLVLSLLWAWMGLLYHFAFFTRINPAAWLFGGAFVVAAGLFLVHALRGTLRFDAPHGVRGVAALVLLSYGLVGYPVVAHLAGQTFPRVPTFGLPCPTTIFTLGMLLLARLPVPASLFVVPILWSAVGTTAALTLGVVEDYGLVVSALVTVVGLLASPTRAGEWKRLSWPWSASPRERRA